jgi:hypothetical protein
LVHLAITGQLDLPPAKVFQLCDFKEAIQYNDSQSLEHIRTKVVFECVSKII